MNEVSNGGVQRSSVLYKTSARNLDSGLYYCSATLSVPDSTTVMANQSVTVTIQGTFTFILQSQHV